MASRESLKGLLLSVIIGVAGYAIHLTIKTPIAEPLLIAMTAGIIVRMVIRDVAPYERGFNIAVKLFLPPGLVFYALHNLNFTRLYDVNAWMLLLLLVVMSVYFISILIAGKVLRQKKEITYLTATGSSICGASAIVITSPVVKAKPPDVSISILSVTIASLAGLFIILPFLATLTGMTNMTFGILSGMVLQLTSSVKIAVQNTPYLKMAMPLKEVLPLSLAIKAVRYMGLLAAIPILSSLGRDRSYLSWVLLVFLISGLTGTYISLSYETLYSEKLSPFIHLLHEVSWAITLAAIGLNTEAAQLMSNNGLKALIMAFTGFFLATAVFFIGLYVLQGPLME